MMIVQVIAISALIITFFSCWTYLDQKVVEKRNAPIAKRISIISFITYAIFYGIWMIAE